MKLGVFPGGLLALDLKELVIHGFISDDWKATLMSLFTNDIEQSPQGYIGSDINTTEIKQCRTPVRHNTPQPIESFPISTGDFLWIQINKISSLNEVLLIPTQAVNEFLIREFQNEIKEIELMRLQYLTLLSQSLLAKIRSLSIYHESLLENSAFCQHGLWALTEDNSFYKKFLKDEVCMMSYLYNSNIKTAKDIQNIYNIHESNLSSSLRLSLIKPMIANTGTLALFSTYD